MEGPAEEDAGRAPSWLGRGHDPLRLRRRAALLSDHEAVRRRRHQSRAALARDRQRLGARGDGEVLHRHPLRRLQRLPAQARGAVREGRRPAHRRGRRDVGQARRRMVHRTARPAQSQAERDRGAGAQGNPRPAQIPGRRRAGISHAGARIGHAVGRRKPAHPARLADRLGAHRRALRARRAVDRAAPARQCAAAGNAQAAARPRQHRDRGRARRGRHPHRRPRARHRPRRRHSRRPRDRAGHGRRHHRRARVPHRQISLRRDDRSDSGAPAEESRGAC